jgi:phosphohistidine swiveling domain-containing protein
MKVEKINPNNYDLLWEFQGGHYLLCSIYISVYSRDYKRDFIAYSSGNDKQALYISKAERKKISKKGFELYYKGFKKYEEKIKKQLKSSQKFIFEAESKNLKSLSNFQLSRDFKNTINYMLSLWKDYFWTDYFCTDKVSYVIDKNDKNFNLQLLKNNTQKMGKLKFLQRKIINKTVYKGEFLDKYYKEINRRLKLKYNPINYSYKELISLLRGKKILIPDRNIWIKGKFSKGKDILGENALKLIKELSAIDKNIIELKGSIGNRGYYRGIVRKIEFDLKKHNYVKEIQRMKKGEVLVSGTTGPELILACKKAGAIITEEGGIASHAAIVSRELGIPSVIGTKIATKVLNDGDLVEVDANKGIIKIIKKAK